MGRVLSVLYDDAPVFVVRIDPRVADANTLGEYLREQTFDPTDGYGCYESFKYREDAEPLPADDARDFFARSEEVDQLIEYHGVAWCDEDGDLTVCCYWYWDGDGVLAFDVFDASATLLRSIKNTDCKKSNRWVDESGFSPWGGC